MGELAKTMRRVTSKMRVSFTRNATFEKRALASACFVYAKRYFQNTGRFSSTRNTRFFENCALVYAKHYFFASRRMEPSRQAPCASWKAALRRPEPATGQSCHFFCAPPAAKWHANSCSKFWRAPTGLIKRKGLGVKEFSFLLGRKPVTSQ